MRGLLAKDCALTLQRGRGLFILVFVGIIMGLSTDGSFVVGYLSLLCAILTTSTISYDEYDNGYAFLMTLPVTRKEYVLSKYLFCLSGGLVGWILSMLIFIGCNTCSGHPLTMEDLTASIIFIPIFILIIAIMLPLHLWLGAEKSRIALAVLGGGVFALSSLIQFLAPDDMQVPGFISNASDAAVVLVMFGISVVITLISWGISTRIMSKKEF